MVDVDGVLVRGRPDDGRRWSAELERDLGLDVAALQREFFAPHWDAIVTGQAELMDCLPPILARIAPGLDPAELVAYWFRQDSRIDRDLLADLACYRAAGLGVHLATNQEHLRARYLMGPLGLAGHVDTMIYSGEMGCRKPDPAFFAGAAARVGAEPRHLVLVDDLAENVAAARAAGWNAVPWTGRQTLAEALAECAAGLPALQPPRQGI